MTDIPKEAIEAAARAVYAMIFGGASGPEIDEMAEPIALDAAKEALTAAAPFSGQDNNWRARAAALKTAAAAIRARGEAQAEAHRASTQRGRASPREGRGIACRDRTQL